MERALIVAALFAASINSSASHAATVTVTGAGVLSTAFGSYSVGDPFSFTTTYDDAAAFQYLEFGNAFYAPSGAFYFTVDGTSFVDNVRNFTVVVASPSYLSLGGRGDHFPNGGVSLLLGRTDPSNVSLPTAEEIAGKPGNFSFSLGASGGSGVFVEGVLAAPEPGAWATMLGGLLLAGGYARRRHRTTVRYV